LNTAKPFCLSVLLICLALPSSRCEQVAPNKEDALSDRVDKLVQDKMYNEQIPGLALAVIKDGKILKVQAYGFADVDSKVPATTNTVFRIGSVSKQFVATAIMMLVEEGKLNLDDPVSKYLDGTPRRWKKITIRHLLTHTSGIPDFLNENIPVDTSPDAFDQSVFKAVARRSLHFVPGDDWRYSNSNYHLLAMIIRKNTGKSYGDFLRERIFEPLGMTRTVASPENGIYPGLASGYKWDNGLRPADSVAASVKAYAGGGILSTILDMAKWDAALYTDRLLKKTSLQQMWTPVRLNDGMTWRYGFGWAVGHINDHLIISHNGNITGFSSAIEHFVDDRLTVIILDNRFYSYDAVAALGQKIARIYLWTGPDYQPIPDKEPEITARVRDIMDRCDHGRLRAANFTTAMWAELSPWRKQMQQDGKTFGAALSLVLVERTTEVGRRSYRYRVQYKFGTVLLHVVFDEQNKIAVWKVEDVDLN
jgi:CubicO group peptidase (beta-lactamase class C family)